MRVVGTHVDAVISAQLLKPHPDVGLDVLDQMADVDVAIGVGECGGNENAAICHSVYAEVRRLLAIRWRLRSGIVAHRRVAGEGVLAARLLFFSSLARKMHSRGRPSV